MVIEAEIQMPKIIGEIFLKSPHPSGGVGCKGVASQVANACAENLGKPVQLKGRVSKTKRVAVIGRLDVSGATTTNSSAAYKQPGLSENVQASML